MQGRYLFGQGWRRAIPLFLLLPGLAIYLIFSFFPSLATFLFSFTDITNVPRVPWHWIGLENYHEFFFVGVGARDNLEPLFRTLIFAFFTVIINNAFALFAALLLNQRLRLTNFFRALFFVPAILGVTVNAMLWNLFLYPLDGPAQRLIGIFGLQSEFLGSPKTAFPLVIMIMIWASMGFAMVIYLAGLQNIPQEIVEAGLVDGANPFQSFFFIIFPLLAPTVTVNLLIGIIGALKEWALILLLTGGQFKTSVIGLQIYSVGFAATRGASARQGYAAAISMLQFIMILVIAGIAQVYLRRREERLL
jgi:raffinose/stachyose/melibiose transport system permease protein